VLPQGFNSESYYERRAKTHSYCLVAKSMDIGYVALDSLEVCEEELHL
jgi:hypothetical protein